MPGEREPLGKLAGERGQLGRLETGGASGPLSDRKDYRRPAGKGVFSLLSAASKKGTPGGPAQWESKSVEDHSS